MYSLHLLICYKKGNCVTLQSSNYQLNLSYTQNHVKMPRKMHHFNIIKTDRNNKRDNSISWCRSRSSYILLASCSFKKIYKPFILFSHLLVAQSVKLSVTDLWETLCVKLFSSKLNVSWVLWLYGRYWWADLYYKISCNKTYFVGTVNKATRKKQQQHSSTNVFNY